MPGSMARGSDLGNGTVLEEARVLGELHKQGWNPKRTIILCAWDGEEPACWLDRVGRNPWRRTSEAGRRLHQFRGNDRGFFYAGGSHDLQHLINDVTRDIQDPENTFPSSNERVWSGLPRTQCEERAEIRKSDDVRVHALGDGSDYTAFMDHAGISALSIGYDGEDDGDVYHSIYDDFYWYTRLWIPTSLTGARWHKPGELQSCGWRMPT